MRYQPKQQCLQVYGFIRNFTEMNEILRVKSAELRIFTHPAPLLLMHVHRCIAMEIRKMLEKYGIH